jgi:hypothetical protein
MSHVSDLLARMKLTLKVANRCIWSSQKRLQRVHEEYTLPDSSSRRCLHDWRLASTLEDPDGTSSLRRVELAPSIFGDVLIMIQKAVKERLCPNLAQ